MGCYKQTEKQTKNNKKTPQTGCCKQQTLLLRVLEVGKSMIKVPGIWCLVRTYFLVHRRPLFYSVLTSWKVKELSVVSFLRKLIPLMSDEAPPS